MTVGATNLFFNRDTKVYLSQGGTIWELPVLNGYSFSQTTNSSNVTLSEMADQFGRSRRGQRVFNDSMAPAEWSFDIYARPTLASSFHRAPEEALWNALFSARNFSVTNSTAGIGGTFTAAFTGTTITLTFTSANPSTSFSVGDAVNVSGLTATTNAPNGTFAVTGVTATTLTYEVLTAPTGTITATSGVVRSGGAASSDAQLDFSPAGSNRSALTTFELIFVLGANAVLSAGGTANYAATGNTTIYRIADCCVNEATMNFEVDGIATVSWSGMGRRIEELATYDATAALQTGLASTNNMIRNRITSATLVGLSPTQVAKTYSVTLTGGSITISNNMTFLTPETLGVVNTPLGHVTGGRSISGSLTCYADEADNGSIELYEDMLLATTAITNRFQLQINVGGSTAPFVQFDMGQCHLEIPTMNTDDVIGFEVNYTALPSTISGTDELNKIRYVGVA
jgi:hypothetical protein